MPSSPLPSPPIQAVDGAQYDVNTPSPRRERLPLLTPADLAVQQVGFEPAERSQEERFRSRNDVDQDSEEEVMASSGRSWLERSRGVAPDGPIRHWRGTRGGQIRAVLVVVACMMMSLLAGTSNAFNAFASRVQRDTDVSDVQMAVISGFGFLGLYFVLPAGMVLDSFGPLRTSVAGSVIMCSGFVIFSFGHHWGVLLLGLSVMSFGAGAVFMCALKVAIMQSANGGGWSVSLTSAAMSLSAAFAIFIVSTFGNVTNCTQDDCWRNDFRFLAVCTAIITLPGACLLIFFNEREYPHLHEDDCESVSEEDGAEDNETIIAYASTSSSPGEQNQLRKVLTAMLVFKSPFFLGLMFSVFSSIGASVLILTKTSQIWNLFNVSADLDAWGGNILVVFSFTNAAANIVSGVGADWLDRRYGVRPTTVLGSVQLFFCGAFVVTGLVLRSDSTQSMSVLLIALLSSVGILFGSTLVLFPVVVGSTYGQRNFGKYFAFLQFASSAASLAIPPFATAVADADRGYSAVFFILASFLLVSSGLLRFLPPPNDSVAK